MTAYLRLGQIADLVNDKRELLQGRDDDLDARFQGLGQLVGVLVNLGDDALLVLELVDGVLQLLVQDAPVGDDNDALKDGLGRPRRAGWKGRGRARQWSCFCRSRRSAEPDNFDPPHAGERRPPADARHHAGGSGGRS